MHAPTRSPLEAGGLVGFVTFKQLQGGTCAQVDPATAVLRAADFALWREARDVLEDARREADRIRNDARTAYEAERKKGYAEGQAQAQLEQAERMIEIASRSLEYFGRVERSMVDLVTDAVRKIIAGFSEHERVVMVVKSALSVVRNQKQMTLRVAPAHLETVKNQLSGVLSDYPGIGFLDVVGDQRLNGDACLLESDIGSVEASMAGQIAALHVAFEKVFGSRI
jgi:type III secretion protein L